MMEPIIKKRLFKAMKYFEFEKESEVNRTQQLNESSTLERCINYNQALVSVLMKCSVSL